VTLGQARALAGLGRCDLAAGRIDEAGEISGRPLEIFPWIGAAGAAVVTAGLGVLRVSARRAPGSGAG
jgi:hypothetical protein